jgi:hypothetical protein
MKFRIERARWEEITIYTAKRNTRHFGKEVSPAAATLRSRRRLQGKSVSLAARYRNCRRWIKGDSIAFAVNGLAVVAMADVRRHRFTSQLHLDDTATTSNMGDDTKLRYT